jgi:hypothetical protein
MIYLTYGIYNNGTIEWRTPPEGFSETRVTELTETTRVNGLLLNQEPYTHLLASRTVWELVISADELATSSKYNFMIDFFNADAWRYGGDSYGYGYCEVFLRDEGLMPVTFLEDHTGLPEVVFKLAQKTPV